jgi:isoquinoline 1-oxidoreductase beta subunit
MIEIVNLSRRRVLKGTLAGGAVLGLHVGAGRTTFAAAPLVSASGVKAVFAPNVYVSVAPSGEIALVVHRSEMGTGIRTSLAMILADELDADRNTVEVVQAQGDAKYGDQNTDGSRSIRQFFRPLREAGGSARQMLIAAARWHVSRRAAGQNVVRWCTRQAGGAFHMARWRKPQRVSGCPAATRCS